MQHLQEPNDFWAKYNRIREILNDSGFIEIDHYRISAKSRKNNPHVVIDVFNGFTMGDLEEIFSGYKFHKNYELENKSSISLYLENVEPLYFPKSQEQKHNLKVVSLKKDYTRDLSLFQSFFGIWCYCSEVIDSCYTFLYFRQQMKDLAISLLKEEVDEVIVDPKDPHKATYRVTSAIPTEEEEVQLDFKALFKEELHSYQGRVNIINFILGGHGIRPLKESDTGFSSRITVKSFRIRKSILTQLEQFDLPVIKAINANTSFFVSCTPETDKQAESGKTCKVLFSKNLEDKDFQNYLNKVKKQKQFKNKKMKKPEKNKQSIHGCKTFDEAAAYTRKVVKKIWKNVWESDKPVHFGTKRLNESHYNFILQTLPGDNDFKIGMIPKEERISAITKVKDRLPDELKDLLSDKSYRGRKPRFSFGFDLSGFSDQQKSDTKTTDTIEELTLSKNQYEHMFNQIPAEYRKEFINKSDDGDYIRVNRKKPIKSIVIKLHGEEMTLNPNQFKADLNLIE